MISETTNFSRDSIGTPTLNAYEDIRLNEVSLKEIILDDSETETADVVSILGIENFIRRDAETIHAFRFGCKDYFGRYFNYVTVRRQIGDNNMNSFESTNDVWMAAICYDKNNNIVETFFSNERNRQENGVYETTWNFDPFIIKSSYAFIEFRITQTEGEVNLNPNSHSMRIRTSNIIHNPNGNSQKKFYLDGWYTIDQSNSKSDFTTDFVVGMTKRYSSLTKHIRDIDIHLDSDLREKIEKSADNSVIIKIENDLNEHINTKNLHLNEERLKIIESIPDTVSEIVDGSLKKTIITDNLTSNGSGLIYGADLDLKRISSGTIKSISIKNPGGSSESAQGNHYLALQFFKEGDPDTTNEYKSLEETYFSKELVNLTTSSDYNFDFDGVNVPHDIKFVRLMLTTSNTEIPNPRDTNTVSLMRVRLTNYNKESEEDSYVFSKGNGYSIRNKGILSNCCIIYDNIESLVASEKIFYTHKNDSSLHFDTEEKSFLIKESFTYTPFEEGDVDDNFNSCHGFQLGPKHIKSGLLKEIRIPHSSSSNTDITDENGNYMAVQIFRNGDPDLSSDNKSLFETHYSENKHIVKPNDAGEYHFTFNDLYIPSSFKYVRFIPVKSKDVVPNGFNISNCSKMALIPIKRNNTTNFDDDGCYVLIGNNNKKSLLTKCTLIYSKEKTNIPFYDIVSRGWRFEVPNSSNSTTEQSVKTLHENLMQNDNAVVSSCVYESNYYNPTTSEFEKSKNTYIITIIYPTPKSGEEVIETFDNFNLRSGYDTDYPILYPIYF